jgi:anti-sigma-K factor RskA
MEHSEGRRRSWSRRTSLWVALAIAAVVVVAIVLAASASGGSGGLY